MKRAADTLFLLAAFSIRTGQIEKAVQYSNAGCILFPTDHRLIEMQAYALLLQERFEEAEHVLSLTEQSTPNLDYLRSRTAIILNMPKSECQARLRRYLSQ
jgi:hypothetical protein